MAKTKRPTRSSKLKPPTLQGTLSYAAVAARGFQQFLDECRRIGASKQFDTPALPVLGRIVKADPEVGRLALAYLETTKATR